MVKAQARIRTASAQKYLQQLCKHWSHSHETSFTPEHGRVLFDGGRVAEFEAVSDELVMRLEAPEWEALDRFKGTVVRHLQRFAFREPLGEPQWTDA